MRYWIFAQDIRLNYPVLIAVQDDDTGLVGMLDAVGTSFVLHDKAANLPYPFFCPYDSEHFLRYVPDVDSLNDNMGFLPAFVPSDDE
jgi:hypothetical protein